MSREFTRWTSQIRARVNVEPRVKFESGSVSFFFFLDIFDSHSCFHSDVPTTSQNVKRERDIFPLKAIAKVYC